MLNSESRHVRGFFPVKVWIQCMFIVLLIPSDHVRSSYVGLLTLEQLEVAKGLRHQATLMVICRLLPKPPMDQPPLPPIRF